MNSVIRQLWEQNTDVVMVDTGNSYEGLCKIKGTVLLVCCLFCCMIFDALQRLLHSLFL